MRSSVVSLGVMVLGVFLLFGCASSAFEKAKGSNTIAAYDQFLAEYGDSDFAVQARILKDDLLFKEVQKQNKLEAFDSYEKAYPQGTHRKEIEDLREKWWYEPVEKEKSLSACEAYLKRYPKGKYQPLVIAFKEQLLFNQAQQQKTVPAYQSYLEAFPQGKYRQEAQSAIEKIDFETPLNLNNIAVLKASKAENLLKEPQSKSASVAKIEPGSPLVVLQQEKSWVQVETLNQKRGWLLQKDLNYNDSNAQRDQVRRFIEHYESYLRKYPQGQFIKQANEALEKATYHLSFLLNTIAALESFLSKYPQSTFAPEAQKLLEGLYWKKVQESPSIQAYKFFLKKYPDSAFISEVKSHIAQLIAEEKAKTLKPGTARSLEQEAEQALEQVLTQEMETEALLELLDTNAEPYTGKHSVEGYMEYLRKHRGTPQARQAEHLLYQYYEREHTIEGYKRFVTENPLSVHVAEAVEAVYELYQEKNTIEGYDQFISLYPQSRKRDLVIQKQFELYTQLNSIEGYEMFRNKYRDSPLADQALAYIFVLYQKKGTVNDYEGFINLHPRSPQVYESIAAIYRAVLKENIIPGYVFFVKKYPNTREALDALKQIETLAFSQAQKIGTVLAYEEFQRALPYAEYAEEAGKLAYDKELKAQQTAVAASQKKINVLEKISQKMQLEARSASQRKDYWIAERKYNILLDSVMLKATNAVKLLLQDREAEINHSRYTEELQEILETQKNIRLLIKTELQNRDTKVPSLGFRQGQFAQVVDTYLARLERAKEQSLIRSPKAIEAHQQLFRSRSDQEHCQNTGSWLCGVED
ncbi:SH3 domain-containing protein [Deltaproteobacteria bacterium TL4]